MRDPIRVQAQLADHAELNQLPSDITMDGRLCASLGQVQRRRQCDEERVIAEIEGFSRFRGGVVGREGAPQKADG